MIIKTRNDIRDGERIGIPVKVTGIDNIPSENDEIVRGVPYI